jgi:hypothetical protein
MSSASAPAIPVKHRHENVVVVHGADANAYKRLAAKKSPHNMHDMHGTQTAKAVRVQMEGAEAASVLASATVALASFSPTAYRSRAVSDLRKLFDVPAPIPAPPSLKPPEVLAQRPPRPTANVSAPFEATAKHTVAPQGPAPTEECLKENCDRNARPGPAAFAAEPGLDQHHPQPRREPTEETLRVVKRTSKLPCPSTSSPRRWEHTRYLRLHTQTVTHVRMENHTNRYFYTHARTNSHTRTHARTHTHTHTHTHTRTHTHINTNRSTEPSRTNSKENTKSNRLNDLFRRATAAATLSGAPSASAGVLLKRALR